MPPTAGHVGQVSPLAPATGNGLKYFEEEFSDGRRAPLHLIFSLDPILTVSLQNPICICLRDGPECECRLDTLGQLKANLYMI